MRHQQRCWQRNLWNSAISILVVLAFTACDRYKPIKIGFVGGLTGKFSNLGTAGRDGVLLALEEWNEAGGIGGRQLVLVTKDDKQDADTGAAVVRELIDEGVVATIGHMTSTMALETLPMINEAGMLTISPTASSNELAGLDDYFIRLVVPYSVTTERLAAYAYQTLGLRKIAIVQDFSNQAFSRMSHDGFRDSFMGFGGQILHTETFLSGSETDYLELTETVLQASPDGVLIIGGTLDTAMLCQRIRIAKPELPLLLSGWLVTQELVQYGGAAVEGVIFVVSEDRQQASYQRFEERFATRFGQTPSFAASYAYNAANMLFEALSIDDDPASLKETILQRGIFQGVHAEFRFDAYGDPHREHFVVTIQDGERVIVK